MQGDRQMKKRVAVIGAGLAGISAARELSKIAEVRLFEKSRGLGGRMATRRAGEFAFDHGAQFFTARSPEFQELLRALDGSVVQSWDARVVTLARDKKTFKREWFETHYVAMPQMNSLAKHLAMGLNVNTTCRVASINRDGQKWHVADENGGSLGSYDWVVLATPAPQARELLPDVFAHTGDLDSVRYSPCYALMLGFDEHLPLNFDAAVLRASPVAWLAVNHQKPGRPAATSLLIHSDNQWAQHHVEDSENSVINALLAALAELAGIDGTRASYTALHRWRYARVESTSQSRYLLDTENQLAACGDWCMGNRVEDAYLSGQALANGLARQLAA